MPWNKALRPTPCQRDCLLAFDGLPAGAELATHEIRRAIKETGVKVPGTQYLASRL